MEPIPARKTRTESERGCAGLVTARVYPRRSSPASRRRSSRTGTTTLNGPQAGAVEDAGRRLDERGGRRSTAVRLTSSAERRKRVKWWR